MCRSCSNTCPSPWPAPHFADGPAQGAGRRCAHWHCRCPRCRSRKRPLALWTLVMSLHPPHHAGSPHPPPAHALWHLRLRLRPAALTAAPAISCDAPARGGLKARHNRSAHGAGACPHRAYEAPPGALCLLSRLCHCPMRSRSTISCSPSRPSVQTHLWRTRAGSRAGTNRAFSPCPTGTSSSTTAAGPLS